MNILDKIKASPLYRKHRAKHDTYCNGDGLIIEISPFHPFPTRELPCPYCVKVNQARKSKEKKAKEKAKEKQDGRSEESKRTQ